jgi:glycosyltransferase involved in cell wall biosynthesis
MIDFSLILPSRGRPQLLRGLLESIKETTARLERLEVLVAVDDDDEETLAVARGVEYPWVYFRVCRRSSNFSRDYYSWLATLSQGRFIMALNDDCSLLTTDWDDVARHYLKDPICYGRTVDVPWLGGDYCYFPMLSRAAFDALTYFFHPSLPVYGADVHLYRVCKAAGIVVDAPVQVRHVRQTTKQDAWDAGYRGVPPELVTQEAERLKATIQECHGNTRLNSVADSPSGGHHTDSSGHAPKGYR